MRNARGMQRRVMSALGLGLLAASLGSCQEYQVISHGHVDVFYQTVASQVDILLVVDSSASMEEEREKLSETFDNFIAYFVGGLVDYHIGVVSTDTSDSVTAGVLRGSTPYITQGTDNAESLFNEAVEVGVDGAGIEMGLQAALLALTDPLASGQNAGFLRPEADLSIIFVSDEDDYSPGSAHAYIDALRMLKMTSSRDSLKMSGVIGNVPEGCSASGVNASPGYRYAAAAEANFGIVESICADDFAVVAENLGLTASGLLSRFELSATPIEETIEVVIDDEQVFSGDTGLLGETIWYYDAEENEVVFSLDSLPPSGSVIHVTYDLYEESSAAIE